jgi:catechol 2,3-dioxygenase-like lactoylglutathione lyase family enzyme
MISGAHVIVHTKDADADRAFFRDVLGFDPVDAGHGWLIFALPPGEAALHPSDKNGPHELYLLCDDLKSEMAVLARKGVTCSVVHEERSGSITRIRLPNGGEMGLYQPKHPTALSLGSKKSARQRSAAQSSAPRGKQTAKEGKEVFSACRTLKRSECSRFKRLGRPAICRWG